MADNRLKGIDELKARMDRFRPLDKSLLRQIREYFRIGLTYSSNALEGNSLTETETKVVALVQDGYPIAIIPPVLRADYLDALRKSQKTPRDDRPFLDFIASVCYESAKEYLRLLEGRTEKDIGQRITPSVIFRCRRKPRMEWL